MYTSNPTAKAASMPAWMVRLGKSMVPGLRLSPPIASTKIAVAMSPSMPSQLLSEKVSSGTSMPGIPSSQLSTPSTQVAWLAQMPMPHGKVTQSSSAAPSQSSSAPSQVSSSGWGAPWMQNTVMVAESQNAARWQAPLPQVTGVMKSSSV